MALRVNAHLSALSIPAYKRSCHVVLAKICEQLKVTEKRLSNEALDNGPSKMNTGERKLFRITAFRHYCQKHFFLFDEGVYKLFWKAIISLPPFFIL